MINTNTLIWIVIAWVMIAFFSGIEVAFTKANKLAIELKKKQGLSSGIILGNFMDNPAQFIGTSISGFTICLVIFGLLVGETFQPLWNILITKIHMPGSYVNAIRLFFETLAASIFILREVRAAATIASRWPTVGSVWASLRCWVRISSRGRYC